MRANYWGFFFVTLFISGICWYAVDGAAKFTLATSIHAIPRVPHIGANTDYAIQYL